MVPTILTMSERGQPGGPNPTIKDNRLVMNITTSEPRDLLMIERNCLSMVKFGVVLSLTSIAMLVNFGFGKREKLEGDKKILFTIFGSIFMLLSLLSLVLGALNYYHSIGRYTKEKVEVFNHIPITGFVFSCFVMIFTVSVVLLTQSL